MAGLMKHKKNMKSRISMAGVFNVETLYKVKCCYPFSIYVYPVLASDSFTIIFFL